MKGEDFKTLSENNRIRIVSLPGYRGNILDRNGEVMVSIRPSFNLYIVPEDTKDINQILSILDTKFDIDKDRIKKAIKLSLPFENVLIKRNIRRDIVAFIEEHNMDMPGIVLNVEPLRSYRNKKLAAHVLGYISEINKTELEELKGQDYRLGDFIGRYGIEKRYENVLKGTKGFKHIEVDSSGRELNILKSVSSEPGNNLVLTLDVNLQKTAERLLHKTKLTGAIVAMDPNNGEILAMVSKPSFDPNLFAGGISTQNWSNLINDKRHPLQNRTIQGQYPPGSTYKIVTAIAGLEEGIISQDTTFTCPGYFKHGRRIYRCWKRFGHGSMNIKKALIQSCDVFFYQLGIKLGIDTIAKYAKKVGLGSLSGLSVQNEKKGLIPTAKWKEEERGEAWLSGETVSASVGQGYNLVTPLQLVNLISTVANGGTLWKPTLVKRIESIDGNVVEEVTPTIIKRVDIGFETMNIIREALLGVVHDKGGTAWRARIKNIQIAGKTGTAQVVRIKDEDDKGDDVPLKLRDHAWFIAYAPYDAPEIAVAVIVEHGGHGGATASPIARSIIKTYYKLYH